MRDVPVAFCEYELDIFAFVTIEALELGGNRNLVVVDLFSVESAFDLVHIRRLHQIAHRAELGCLDGGCDTPVAREYDDLRIG